MTDGHGLMSDEAAADIKEWLGHEDISLAYQARLLGSKGVWSPLPAEIASAPHNAGKWIEIRDSQLKYFTPIERDGVFEVVKTSDARPAITMTHQLLQILGDNGVVSALWQSSASMQTNALVKTEFAYLQKAHRR